MLLGEVIFDGELTVMDLYENELEKIGDFPFPTNPLNDRARGYLLKGKAKTAVGNFGNFIEWRDHPAGLWGNYTYLPRVAFGAGVPGQTYSYTFNWVNCSESVSENGDLLNVWCSADAFDAWYENDDTVYVGVVFEVYEDRGITGELIENIYSVTKKNQWGMENEEIFISLPGDDASEINPNNANVYGDPILKKGIGLIYPWALRPALSIRTDEFDLYEYGVDQEEWTSDDQYEYYGANVAESWLTSHNPKWNTDWQAALKSRINTHNIDNSVGDIFGNTIFTDENDPYPLLAHSAYPVTWPLKYDADLNEDVPFWPGWWAEDYYGNLTPEELSALGLNDCTGTRKDDNCWKEVPGRFISDNDVYMEFDDRWAHQGNLVNTNDEYEQTGYPLGLRVMAEAHSYGVSFAEDIIFFTVKVRNESGNWCAFERNINGVEIPVFDDYGNQICGDGMVMPDGTQLNRGNGFDYRKVHLGFYVDADVVTLDALGNYFHTNADDFMEYYWEKFKVLNDSLIISMAMVYDYDGVSSGATEIGIVAAQLLDTPRATQEIDLDLDDITDIYPGERLKMTNWHWFDFLNRPGVIEREGSGACLAGSPGCPQARNKEEIMFKLMAGDTTNISSAEKAWYFHTDNPDLDQDINLNPHFDSLDGLLEEDSFQEGEPGLDCVLLFSCGPFDLKVGEEVPFSFCIIFGQNKEDLIRNARFAQIMYNSHYQSFSPPQVPQVTAATSHNKVVLSWDDLSEYSIDAVTTYADFEGYKVYKSNDGGTSWGTTVDKIFDQNNIHVGWKPIAQFDLTSAQDSSFCIFEPYNCEGENTRMMEISGNDPLSPWFDLGTNSGLEYTFIDTIRDDCPRCGVIDGMEYTYSVTAYDMGIEKPMIISYIDNGFGNFVTDTIWSNTNPYNWSEPDGYPSIENSKGTSIHDPNFVTVAPGYPVNENISSTEIRVIPNPYIVRSNFNETEFVNKIRFTQLPANCKITIFTISGEKVIDFTHSNPNDSNEWWNLRSMNNQVVAPGLYLFTVESIESKFLGKFAIVR